MHIKKAWSPTIAVPLPEALALPIVLDRQREAHAEYIPIGIWQFNIDNCPNDNTLYIAYAYAYEQHKEMLDLDSLYPVGHLSLLSPEHNWNLRDFW